eukprot:5025348-Amphidinium_carterae.1
MRNTGFSATSEYRGCAYRRGLTSRKAKLSNVDRRILWGGRGKGLGVSSGVRGCHTYGLNYNLSYI